jgi:signal transduction histidine kinase
LNLPALAATWSLRRRLLAMLALASAGLLSGSVALFYYDARVASQRLFDEALRETGSLMLELAHHELEEHGQTLGVQLLEAETRAGPFEFRYQIWTDDMRSAYRSTNLPATPLMSIGAQGFDWAIINGEKWRAYAAWNPSHTLQIQIVQSMQRRQAMDHETLLRLVGASLVLLLLALMVTVWIIERAMRPLRATALSVAQRSADDLRLVDDHDAPSEVRPLLAALNQLLGRVREALRAERRFTADASHELRTPLAAIRINAQVLVGARDELEKNSTAGDLLASVDRSTRLIEQLLAMARADAQVDTGTHRALVALDDLVRLQVREHATLATRRGVTLVEETREAVAVGVPALLTALVRNLIDNALRYTPTGGRVTVSCSGDEDGSEIRVVDTGPGIPPAERQRIFERFYRLADNGEPGSGLGLSIVQRIAELHRGVVSIADGPGGRGVSIAVRFSAAHIRPA